MGKQVVVIASGATERVALPHLVSHLEADGITVVDVRIPPGNKALSIDMADGNVDTSAPDHIHNPKLHLRHLLRQRAYTAVVSEEIAKAMDAQKIVHRSPNFGRFLDALRNRTTEEHPRQE